MSVGEDDDFQITMNFTDNKTGQTRMVHLTGLVSTVQHKQ